jgi:hypothetical protein
MLASGRLAGSLLLRRNTHLPFQLPQRGDKSPRVNLFKPAAKCYFGFHSRKRGRNKIESRNPAGTKGFEARSGRRKHPASYVALSRRNAGILSEVSAIAAADRRPVCTGRVAASPFPLQLLEGAPPGHDGPAGVFSQVCRADFQAGYFC